MKHLVLLVLAFLFLAAVVTGRDGDVTRPPEAQQTEPDVQWMIEDRGVTSI